MFARVMKTVAAVAGPVQPRPGVGPRGVVPAPAPERGEERLRGHILGQVGTQPGVRIAQNLAEVPVAPAHTHPHPARGLRIAVLSAFTRRDESERGVCSAPR